MQQKRGRKPIIHDNRLVKSYLMPCTSLAGACRVFAFAESLFTGVANLDYTGNTRPLSKRTLFDVLRNMDYISIDLVQKRTGYSYSHAQRITLACRVLSKAFARELDSYQIPELQDMELVDYSSFITEDRLAYRQFLIDSYFVV
jgi:hypothetical protein